jgi:hypothetical protein
MASARPKQKPNNTHQEFKIMTTMLNSNAQNGVNVTAARFALDLAHCTGLRRRKHSIEDASCSAVTRIPAANRRWQGLPPPPIRATIDRSVGKA